MPVSSRRSESKSTRYPDHARGAHADAVAGAGRVRLAQPEVMEYVAGLLDLSPAFVASVASFYTMYYKRPIGKHHVQVCTNLSCGLVGADRIVDCLQHLGIGVGETTADGKFSLGEVGVPGSCGTAPMMQINDDYWENLTPERALEIVERLARD